MITLIFFLLRFWVFRSWGRIGTTIGGFKTTEHDTLQDAKKEFKFYYEDQTGNSWKNRKEFIKMPGKKIPVDIDYGQVIRVLNLTVLIVTYINNMNKIFFLFIIYNNCLYFRMNQKLLILQIKFHANYPILFKN